MPETNAARVPGRGLRGAVLLIAWVFLSGAGPAQATTTITTPTLHLAFGSHGSLESVIACFPTCGSQGARIRQFGDAGVVRMPGSESGTWRSRKSQSETHLDLIFESGAGASVRWRIPREGYRLDLALSGVDVLSLRSGPSFRPREAAGFGDWLETIRYVRFAEGELEQTALKEEGEDHWRVEDWTGFRNRFWALVARGPAAARPRAAAYRGRAHRDARIDFEESAAGQWSIYLGPIEPLALAAADPALQELLYAGLWFWLRWICFALHYLLLGIQMLIPSWGLSVMMLSVAVSVLMLPLSRVADRLQQDVNETEARLAPEIRRIKRRYKGEVQTAKILALYKTERVHPLYSLKSMLGVAIVIPVFIGAFDMLAENIQLLHVSFLWISDLSRPDAWFELPFKLPFFGGKFNLLPVLMTGLSFLASALHKTQVDDQELRRKQLRNMFLLALGFFVLFYTFPAGMVLYWATNNLISVIKGLWARR